MRFSPVANEIINLLLVKEIIVHTKDGNIDIFHSWFNKWNFLFCIAPRNKIVAVIKGYDYHICKGSDDNTLNLSYSNDNTLKFKLPCNIKSTNEIETVKFIETILFNTKIDKMFILKNTCNLNYLKTIYSLNHSRFF